MQKALRRVSQAERHAKRRADKIRFLETRRDRAVHRQEKTSYDREFRKPVWEARQRQREDYALGPLAPWRNNPLESFEYGAFSPRSMQPPVLAKADRKKVRDWFIREGDRVVVVRGREGVKGRIGTVLKCEEESQTVRIDGVNRLDVDYPSFAGDGDRQIQSVDAAVPLEDVQLVIPWVDSKTGIVKDVIVNPDGLSREDVHYNSYESKLEWNRYLQPQNIKLDWPDEEKPIYSSEEADTPQKRVEEETYLLELNERPMPEVKFNGKVVGELIDELRGKYSKFRTRHTDEYLESKLKEDEDEERKKRWAELMTTMRRPSEIISEFRHQRKGTAPPKEQRERLWENIGAIMAANKKTKLQQIPADSL